MSTEIITDPDELSRTDIRVGDLVTERVTDVGSETDNGYYDGTVVRIERTDATPATPAPLDPTKVRAGDTVTLERPKRNDKVTAVVVDITVIEFYLDGWGLPFRIGKVDPAWTLTAHQPAPDPEPEWKPGTVGTAGSVRGLTYTGPVVRTDEHLLPWWTPSRVDGAHYHGEDTVSDFVPDEPRPLPTRGELHAALTHDDCLKTDPGTGMTYIDPDLAAEHLAVVLRGESR